MLNTHHFHAFFEELDRWHDAGQSARFWLRDDDAQEITPALNQLITLLRSHSIPGMLAVVPMKADEALANRLQSEPLVQVAMHGVWHHNHAPPDEKPRETPSERGIPLIVEEWTRARARLITLFGSKAGEWYIPPWNRIDRSVAEHLPAAGFRAVSIFSHNFFHLEPALQQVNVHVDLMEWSQGPRGRPLEEVTAKLTLRLQQARERGWSAIGILTHHLVHDQQAWSVLSHIVEAMLQHPAATWISADALLSN